MTIMHDQIQIMKITTFMTITWTGPSWSSQYYFDFIMPILSSLEFKDSLDISSLLLYFILFLTFLLYKENLLQFNQLLQWYCTTYDMEPHNEHKPKSLFLVVKKRYGFTSTWFHWVGMDAPLLQFFSCLEIVSILMCLVSLWNLTKEP